MSRRVLIIDDAYPIRMTLRQTLLRLGISESDLREASSVEEGLQLFSDFAPDIVFLDLDFSGAGATAPDVGMSGLPATSGDTPEPSAGSPRRRGAAGPMAGPGVWAVPAGAPEALGGETLAREILRARPGTRIVLCIGMDPQDPKVRRLVSEGIFGVLSKPIRLPQVREILRTIDEETHDVSRTA